MPRAHVAVLCPVRPSTCAPTRAGRMDRGYPRIWGATGFLKHIWDDFSFRYGTKNRAGEPPYLYRKSLDAYCAKARSRGSISRAIPFNAKLSVTSPFATSRCKCRTSFTKAATSRRRRTRPQRHPPARDRPLKYVDGHVCQTRAIGLVTAQMKSSK